MTYCVYVDLLMLMLNEIDTETETIVFSEVVLLPAKPTLNLECHILWVD